jgi:hypothetical protein
MAKKMSRRQHRKAVSKPKAGRKPTRRQVRKAYKTYKKKR